MDNTITLRIGSTFNGEGLQKLQKGVQQANQHIQKGLSVSNGLASAMAGVDTSASRAATAAGSLVQAFAQGGISGAAFAAVTLVINSHLKDLQEELARTKKEASDLEARLNRGFSDALSARIQGTITNAKNLGTEFERVAKHAEQVAAAISGLQSAKASGGIIALQTQKLNATMGEMDESLRKTIAASYDVQIAEAKLAQVEQDGAAKVEAARQAYLTNQERVANIQSQIAEIDKRIALERKNAAAIKQADADKADQITRQIASLETAKAEMIQKQQDAIAASTALEINYQVAAQNNRNAIEAQTLAVNQTVEAERALKASIEQRARAEEKAMSDSIDRQVREIETANAKKQLSDATANLAKLRADEAKASKDVKEAQLRLKDAVAKYNEDIGKNMSNDILRSYYDAFDPKKSMQSGFAEVLKNMGAIGSAAGEAAVKSAMDRGEIRSTHDYDRVFKEAARQQRREAYKDASLQNSEAARAERLSRMSEKAMSKADKEWLEKYNDVQNARNKAANDRAKAELDAMNAQKNLEELQKAQIDASKSIKNIEKKLEKLGLK